MGIDSGTMHPALGRVLGAMDASAAEESSSDSKPEEYRTQLPHLTRDSSDEDEDEDADPQVRLAKLKADARAAALAKATADKARGKRYRPSAIKDIPGMDVRPSYWYLKGQECIPLDDGILDDRYWSPKGQLSVEKWRAAKLAEWHAGAKELR